MAENMKKICGGCGYFDGFGCNRSPIGEPAEVCPCDLKKKTERCLISKSRIMMYLAELMLTYSPDWGANGCGDEKLYDLVKEMADEIETWEDDSGTASMNGYQKAAARTINPALAKFQVENHAVYCMCSEVGELQGLYQKKYQGHPFDYAHAEIEVGDVLWTVAEYCTSMGWNLADVAERNISKLRERYPDGFDAEKSIHRKEGDM